METFITAWAYVNGALLVVAFVAPLVLALRQRSKEPAP